MTSSEPSPALRATSPGGRGKGAGERGERAADDRPYERVQRHGKREEMMKTGGDFGEF